MANLISVNGLTFVTRAEVAQPTFTLLDDKGDFPSKSVSLADLMSIIANRWGGSIVEDGTGVVLFDIQKDRKTSKPLNAAERRAEGKLAWDRYLSWPE